MGAVTAMVGYVPEGAAVEPSTMKIWEPTTESGNKKLPAASVVPSTVGVAPLSCSVTPGRGFPSSSRIWPVRRVWPAAWTWRVRFAARVVCTPFSRPVAVTVRG